ncbi:voltage-dependent calcium channel subunit alpha-2/delta-3-like isoform X1, partial [Dinothrombium tinctorium]
NFNDAGVTVEKVDAREMTNDFIADISSLFEMKREFVNRIMSAAEELQFKHDFKDDDRYTYDNMKKLYNNASITLFKFFLPFFFNDYDEREEKVKDMKKSHQMRMEKNPVFGDIPINLNHSVIYVFLNVFNEKPEIKNGTKWSEGKERTPQYGNISDDLSSLDLYDCRSQSWYTKSASSVKDLVILWDLSGSMTGQRGAISRDVVLNILDSLTDDDFVAIIGFNDSLYYAVSCFNQQLVETVDEANISLALERFRSYDEQEAEKQSSKCNQAIMLIIDGALKTYVEAFERYNKEQDLPLRVFTYLIRKELVNMQEVYKMACENRGYYTHVAKTAEVPEQVQQYIAMKSRPLVFSKVHPFAFTPIYADIEIIEFHDLEKNKLVKKSKKVRTANLLGVAGIDIPIREIIKYIPAFKLGANGHAFAINNNGYVIFHPDLRPMDLVKPYFSSVDMLEVEIPDNDKGPRVSDENLLQSLLFDAKVTIITVQTCFSSRKSKAWEAGKAKFGIALTFIATRSGLTRYLDLRDKDEKMSLSSREIFGVVHKRAIDELFYKQAVDYYFLNDSAFVFSIPFESEDKTQHFIQAPHALFFGSNNGKAPAAIVGALINRTLFSEFFFSFSKSFGEKVCYEEDNCTNTN